MSMPFSGIGCSADITGTVAGVYDSSTHVFTVCPSDLVASNASCLGLIDNGDVIPSEGDVHHHPVGRPSSVLSACARGLNGLARGYD
ncbi:hypothetical protein AB0L71_12955 [Streptomyces sp. NPDC052052]|uniref:hypothetical protein n=1 Tax=Streptomyces sp. NPDC052052 TaxID=3154756 RepID=UPI003417F5DA